MRLILVCVLSACVPTSYTFSPTVNRTTPREAGCQFAVIAAAPDEPFEELGTLEYYNGDIPQHEPAFKQAIATTVCDAGGHAVIATRTPKGYEAATVIRYSKGFHP